MAPIYLKEWDIPCANCGHPHISHAGYGGPCLDCPNEDKCWKFIDKGDRLTVHNRNIITHPITPNSSL